MTFRVHLQYPKPSDMGLCEISLERNGTALLLSADGQEVIIEMTRARVEWIQMLGPRPTNYNVACMYAQ